MHNSWPFNNHFVKTIYVIYCNLTINCKVLLSVNIITIRALHNRCFILMCITSFGPRHWRKPCCSYRKSHSRCSVTGAVLEISQKTCSFIKKETLAQVLSYEFCEFSKNSFFTEHLWWLLLFAEVFFTRLIQKQPFRGVLEKRCSENKQQICRRTLELYWNHTSPWVFFCKLLHIFRILFPKNISGWLFQLFTFSSVVGTSIYIFG